MMKKIVLATVAAFGLFAAGATFSAVNPAARPAISIAGENTGHYQNEGARYAGGNSGHYQDEGNKFAGENTGRRYDSNQRYAGENTGHNQAGQYS